MPDIEKIKTGIFEMLQRCSWDDIDKERHRFQPVLNDALELLKEQDKSKHGHWVVLENCSNTGVYCSECHTKMFDRYPMKKKFSQYCGHCGAHNDLQVEVR